MAAEKRLDEVLAAQEAAVAEARRAAPAGRRSGSSRTRFSRSRRIAALDADVRRAHEEARWIGANRFTIAWGVVVVALTAVATAIAARVGGSPAVTTIAGAIVADHALRQQSHCVLRELSGEGRRFRRSCRRDTGSGDQD